MILQEWLYAAKRELETNSFTTAQLDAEIILGHTIRKSRTYIHAHPEEELSSRDIDVLQARLDLRKDHVPIAYIIGHKEFYGRSFNVNPAVLIPRPESELLIEQLNTLIPATSGLPGVSTKRLVDVGAGSGCLGITAKLEHPELTVTLIDTSRRALNVAEKNAAELKADVTMLRGDLLNTLPYQPAIILANLPYVDRNWELSPELTHEPDEALYAEKNGLALIYRLLDQAMTRLPKDGYIILEADYRQLDAIATYAKRSGFSETDRSRFSIVLQKV